MDPPHPPPLYLKLSFNHCEFISGAGRRLPDPRKTHARRPRDTRTPRPTLRRFPRPVTADRTLSWCAGPGCRAGRPPLRAEETREEPINADKTTNSSHPLWPDIFAVQRYCGDDPGIALTYKLMNNYLLMSGVAVVAEAVAMGQAAGLDDAMLRDLLFRWPTVAPALHNRLDDIFGGDHLGWFTTRLGAKDVRLAIELAESVGLDLPIARLVARRYEEAAERGWGDADISAVVELLRAERRG
ncbi:NAD-binding protein [Streptosporangium sp. NPDC000396]|uniref:NAD-binding protein n=1 Tax=Streptosporangium sp. NPDC000396 TaxID=3366185 RepID=UPI003673A097